MLVKDLFEQDPTTWRLVNEGVSSNNVTDPETLAYELRPFVCEGEYHSGLRRILEAYLASFGDVQKAAWVSGFYGSGKSHLVKVLRYLWTDYSFGQGQSARTLCKLPDDIRELLKELSTKGKQHGGLHSAGGTLKGGSGSVRVRTLGILFRSLGLPERIPLAQLHLDLRDDGHLQTIQAAIVERGKDPAKELSKPYTSKAFKEAYLKSYPEHGNIDRVSDALMAAYPANVDEPTIDEMLTLMRRALTQNGKVPCTLIVLDEVQQYINTDSSIALEVQEVVEACSNGLDGKVMFVGTGQSALTDTPALQRLMGRFTIKLHLRDNDVDKVIRTIVLRKKEGRKGDIEKVVSTHEGEIARQLKNTKLATRSDDDSVYVADYPLLPVRRRFWEHVLHACDPSGTAAQMRTQLRVTHEACCSVADRELGAIIPGDFLYTQLANDLVISGEMQKRFQEIIDDQLSKPDGKLRSRVCGIVFLMNKLPRNGGDAGIRASAEHISDLLTDNLSSSATSVREAVPKLLHQLRDEGVLMEVAEEYRLQTTEGATWEAEYRRRRAALINNEASIASARGQELSKVLQKSLSGLQYVHGAAKVARKATIHHGSDAPSASEGLVVWVRDGFQESETAILQDIQRRSLDDAAIHVMVPRTKKDEIKEVLASALAAAETVNALGNPHGREGEEARASMISRQNTEEQRVALIVKEIASNARVFLSGGQEIPGVDLKATVHTAEGQVLQRLYPKFDMADSPNWGTVWKKAKEGNGNALSQVGYTGDPNNHPVAVELFNYIGAGKKGSDVEAKYTAAPYGWPKDAVDGTLAVLMVSGHLAARVNSQAVGIGDLDQRKIAQADFRQQHPVLTPPQKLKIKKLFTDAGYQFVAGDEANAAQGFVRFLRELSQKAGGLPPAPAPPSFSELQEFEHLQGNDLLFALYEKETLVRERISKWRHVATAVADRQPAFQLTETLVSQGVGLPNFDSHLATLEAIRTNRSLLQDPDPVSPLLASVGEALRSALHLAHKNFEGVLAHERNRLEENSIWSSLPQAKRDTMLLAADIVSRPSPPMGSDAELAHSLAVTPLSAWRTQTEALSARFIQVLHAAIKEAEPTAKPIQLPGRTIKSLDDLENWIGSVKNIVTEALKDGPVIL
jgi:hypothetical protein